jgi:hypothetical protein
MARGRMLDRRFMESKKLQTVTRDARLAYASILPFLDREGRTIAEPLYLKAIVFRHSDFTIEEIAAAVKALAGTGLVRLYANEDNAAIIEYRDFTRFNSPNAKEAKSDLPGPDDEGSMPCREPLMADAPATHAQSTCNAGGERNVNGTLTINDNVNTPPTPPQPEPPTEDDEVTKATVLTAKRDATRHAASLLTQQHPETRAALEDLQSIYTWKPAQYRAIAATILDLAREHGTERTAAALNTVVTSGAQIANPIAYAKKILADTPAGASARREYDLDAMFAERPVN